MSSSFDARSEVVNQLCSALRERLFQHISVAGGMRVWVLLDANHPVAEFDALHPARLVVRDVPATMTRVPRYDFAHKPAICPILLQLRNAEDRGYIDDSLILQSVLSALERRTSINGAYVCGWMVSSMTGDQLAKHLVDATVVLDPLSKQRRVFPWFEPYRLALALEMESQTLIERWFRGISAWLFVDSSGELREVAPHGSMSTQVSGGQCMELRHARSQTRVTLARQVMLALAKAGHAIPARAEVQIDRALQLAEAAGMQDVEDTVLYAMNDMTASPGWHLHPAAQHCIQAAVRGTASLRDGLAQLSAVELGAIANHTNKPPMMISTE